MNVKLPITPTITVGDQPDGEDLKALVAEGYIGVVNLRNEGEPEQPLSPSAEGETVKALGLNYLHVGVGAAPLSQEGVGAFCLFLDEHAAGRTLVHCRKAGRAVALVALYLARKEGWTANDVAVKAGEHGLKLDGGLRTLVETYLRDQEG